jgi:stringent starvation protein B
MTYPTVPDVTGGSTKPYLLRAIHEWCTDNGFTPYIAVYVDHRVRVPMEYVKNKEIVLNVGFEATSGLKMANDWIEFKARFGGHSREISVPVDHVIAIYARENGQGMAFPPPEEVPQEGVDGGQQASDDRSAPDSKSGPYLTLTQPGVLADADEGGASGAGAASPPDSPPSGASSGKRPSLKRVK